MVLVMFEIVRLYMCSSLGLILMVILLVGIWVLVREILFNWSKLFLIFLVIGFNFLRGILFIRVIL